MFSFVRNEPIYVRTLRTSIDCDPATATRGSAATLNESPGLYITRSKYLFTGAS